MSQLAKLFIRGSLMNVTAKNLEPDQKREVEDLMHLVWEDPELESAKIEFCSILRRTIGNEYLDPTFAQSEIWITFWRAAVKVLFHAPSDPTKHEKWLKQKEIMLTNPNARKKYFKTFIYQYMRQILNENKIQMRSIVKTLSGPATTVAADLIEFYLKNIGAKKVNYSVDSSGDETIIACEVALLPMKTLKKLREIKKEFLDYGAVIEVQEDKILISSAPDEMLVSKKLEDKERASFNSMSGFSDDDAKNSFQQHCEYQAENKMEEDVDNMLIQDQIDTLASRLPEDAAKILELMVSPPKDFLDEFYPNRKKTVRPRETHIAKWLGMSKNAVNKNVKLIQLQAAALDIG